MQGINKKYNRIGKIVATAFILLIVLMSFMIKIDPPMLIPEEPEDEVVAVLDFTPPVNAGGASSGGSEKISDTKEEDAAPDKETTETDPIPEENTQVEPSPVVTKPSNNSSKADGEGSSQTPAVSGNPFAGSGGGDNGGDGAGSNGTGVGAGDGPGIGNGVGDGESRIPVKNPVVKNPVQDQGRVMLELIIDREGKVLSVKVLKSHSLTTTTNESHFKTAEKAAWDWEFNKDPDGAEKQKLYKSINFTLD